MTEDPDVPKPDPGIKLFDPHSADCFYAERGEDCFISHVGWDWQRDRIGRRRKGICGGGWHVFHCNTADCTGRVGVRWDVLMNFIADGLAGAGVTREDPHA